MAQEKKLIPKRRFKEFQNDGDWEPRKVEGYATFLKGNGLSWNDITKDGQQECILYGNLYTDYGMIAEDVVYKTNTQLKNGIYSKFGDVLIPASDTTPTGLARATSIEKTGVLLGGDINVIRPCDEIDGSCLSLAINTNRKELIKLIKGTTVKHIYNSDIKNIYITLPKSIEEQRKLVLLFKDIDNLITLQQHKLEKIKSMKKAYLYEMFPAEGESKPKRRFNGFSDDWEQYKLFRIADVRDGTHDSPKYVSQGHPFVTSKNVGGGHINYDDIQYISDDDFKEINKRSKVDVNDILIGMIGTIGNIALVRTEPDFAIKNVALIKDTKQVNYLYLYHYLQSSNVVKQLFDGMDGGTQKFIALGKIRELNIMVPSEQEQLKLGTYFESIDNLITLHQSKLDKLKNLKKSYLNEMFI